MPCWCKSGDVMRRSLLLGVLAWVAVVTVASGVTWTVINAAGQQVLSETDPSPVARAALQPTQVSPAATPRPQGRPKQPASPSSGPVGSSSPSSHAQPNTGYEERTWRGASGEVVARCAGTRFSLQGGTPFDGYHAERGPVGPHGVEFTFESSTGREVQVKAVCEGGVPKFSTQSVSSDE